MPSIVWYTEHLALDYDPNMLLEECKNNTFVEVVDIHPEYIDPQMGLYKGQTLRILSNHRSSQILIELLGNRFGLSKFAAKHVEVKIIDR